MNQRLPKEEPEDSVWRRMLEQDIAEMMADPCLSDDERAELLRQLELSASE